MVKHLLESVKVEAVANVLFVHSAEELMVFQITEPVDPAIALL